MGPWSQASVKSIRENPMRSRDRENTAAGGAPPLGREGLDPSLRPWPGSCSSS